MGMSFVTMQSDVRARLVEPAARYFTDAEIKRWINLGYKDFVGRTEWSNRVKGYRIIANQAYYDLPSDFMKVEELIWKEQYKIVLTDTDEWRWRVSAGPTTSSSRPQYANYQPADRKFRLWPAPSANCNSKAIAGAHGTSDTSILFATAADAATFRRSGRLLIDSEQIIYDNTENNALTGAIRGADDTTAATHDSGITAYELDLLLLYRNMPVDLSADADEPKIPDVWREALVLYATKIGLQKRGQWKEASGIMQEYLRLADQALLERKREQLDRHWAIKDEDYYNGLYNGGW